MEPLGAPNTEAHTEFHFLSVDLRRCLQEHCGRAGTWGSPRASVWEGNGRSGRPQSSTQSFLPPSPLGNKWLKTLEGRQQVCCAKATGEIQCSYSKGTEENILYLQRGGMRKCPGLGKLEIPYCWGGHDPSLRVPTQGTRVTGPAQDAGLTRTTEDCHRAGWGCGGKVSLRLKHKVKT